MFPTRLVVWMKESIWPSDAFGGPGISNGGISLEGLASDDLMLILHDLVACSLHHLQT